MGKCKFVGFRYIDYTNKAGQNVKGYSLYFTEERTGVEGVAVFDSFVNVDTFTDYFSFVELDSFVELRYNRYGRVCGCFVME